MDLPKDTMAYKFKPNKAVAKRFKVTVTGKILRRKPGLRHLASCNSSKRKRRLGKVGQVHETMVDRIKELINRGGEKISPREIDEALLRHPSVAEACCFGIPDRIYGEGVAAAVVLKAAATEKELIAHCRSSLSDFKCPATIYILDSIPRTATGKIQRRNVAAAITAENQ